MYIYIDLFLFIYYNFDGRWHWIFYNLRIMFLDDIVYGRFMVGI